MCDSALNPTLYCVASLAVCISYVKRASQTIQFAASGHVSYVELCFGATLLSAGPPDESPNVFYLIPQCYGILWPPEALVIVVFPSSTDIMTFLP